MSLFEKISEFFKKIFTVKEPVGATPADVQAQVPAEPVRPIPRVETYVPLSWEAGKPANQSWSEFVFATVKPHIEKFSACEDITFFRKDWFSLSTTQKVNVIGELVSAMAYFESGWNQKSASVDVGTASDKKTWSIGLLQMSVVDQKNYKLNLNYSYDELLTAIPNLDLALAILIRQVEKYKRLALTSRTGLYWAVMYRGGKYDKSDKISLMTNALKLSGATTKPVEEKPLKASRQVIADKIVELIQKDVTAQLRETHGKNRSPRIDSFNKRVGTALGSPYCASGGWCAIDDACKALGLKNPVKPTASSQDFRRGSFVPSRYIRAEGSLGKKGDVGVLQVFGDDSHGHHTTLSKDQVKQPYFETVEYNTDAISGDRDGDGAYGMKRSTVDRSSENSGKLFICFSDIPQWIADYNS